MKKKNKAGTCGLLFLSRFSFDEDPMGFWEFYFLSISLGDNEMDEF